MPARARRFVAILLGVGVVPLVSLAATTCTITANASMAFGTYDVYATADLTSSTTVTYLCKGFGAHDTAQIGISTGAGGSFTPRTMSSGANSLDYNLYQDAACTTIWGDGTGGSSLMTVAQRTMVSVPVFGRIPALQDAVVGAYSDSVVVTIYY